MIRQMVLAGLGAAVLASQPAMAADMPLKAPPRVVAVAFSWTGCYIGVHGGAGWGEKRWYDAAGVEFADRRHDVDGWLVGGQVGCNWQRDRIVFGIEGQAAWADIEGGARNPLATGGPNGWFTEIDAVGSIAARLGVTAGAEGRLLIFVKGGAAFAHERQYITIAPTNAISSTTEKDLRWGWMLGGGFEYAFNNNWSGKAEYNYNNFGTEDITLCPVAGGACTDNRIKQHLHIFKIGINYRFGGPVVARY